MALHVLLVDDDEAVRPVLAALLEDAGLTVTSADSGLAMREILGRDSHDVDVIVLDCRMPGEPSADLALHAKRLRLQVVMMSGSIEAMQFADENGLQLLWKPFRGSDLLAAIQQAMDSGKFGQRKL